MAKPTIVTRAGKGSALTHAEGDANFTNLQTAAVPDGGFTGEYLVKNSATNWDFGWTDRVNAKTIFETVKNDSGGELTKGTPVYQISVTVGNTITVGAARADDPTKLAVGVLDETLADEAEGRMIVLGEIKGVNTSGFSAGDKVYLGATGGYTNVAPTSSSVAVQFLGVVNRVDASNGSGFITGTLTEDYVRYTGTDFEFWTGTAWQTAPVGYTGSQGDIGYTGSAAAGGGGAVSDVALLTAGTGTSISLTTGTDQTMSVTWTEKVDPGSIVSVTSDTFTLVAGDYLITLQSAAIHLTFPTAAINTYKDSGDLIIRLRNSSDSTDIQTQYFLSSRIDGNGYSIQEKQTIGNINMCAYVSIAATKDFIIRYTNNTNNKDIPAYGGVPISVKIEKLS